MVDIFGGDCERIAQLRVICETVRFSDMSSSDQRLSMCLSQIVSVEKVLEDLGFRDALQRAMERERLAATEVDDGSHDASIEQLAHAAVESAKALEQEQARDTAGALASYEASLAALSTAVASMPPGDPDIPKVQAHMEQIDTRRTYLSGLGPKEEPTIPPEEHVQCPQLSVYKNREKRDKLILACAAVGVSGGLVMLGPLAVLGTGAAMTVAALTGTACAGGALGGYCATREDGLGDTARGVGQAALDKSRAAKALADEQGITSKVNGGLSIVAGHAAEIDKSLKLSDHANAGLEAATRRATTLDQKYKVSEQANAGFSAASTMAASLDSQYIAGFGAKAYGTMRSGVKAVVGELSESDEASLNAEEESAARRAFFCVLDHNSDGQITRDEWDQSFDILDENGDGSLSRKEWYLKQGSALLFDLIPRKELAAISRKEWATAFSKFDPGGVGYITGEAWLSVGQV